MKTATDPRHQKRILTIQELFALSFANKKLTSSSKLSKPIIDKIAKMDPVIEEAAPQFPVGKISKIDVAILRLAIYELMFEKSQPKKVIIDEAVELAKEFGGDKSPSFINGVLGKVVKNYFDKI